MTWKCFRLVFEIKSPIHIGYGARLGIVEKTRYYIPSKTIWGAVTAKIAREINGNYEKIREFAREHLRFTYFYLKDGNKIYYPSYEEKEGLKFGNISKEEFENRFITSFMSTALEKNSKTAEEGSLHEFEVISNKTDNGKDVNLIGYLFTDLEKNRGKNENGINYFVNEINDTSFKIQINGKLIDILEIIKNLQLGGERSYGFGKVELNKCEKKEGEVNLYNSEIRINLDKKVIEGSENKSILLLAHLKIKDKNGEEFLQNIVSIEGDVEPFVGREWGERGVGEKIKFEGIFVAPGSKVRLKEGTKLTIGEYGFWEINRGCL